MGAALQADGETRSVYGLKHEKEKRSMDQFAGLDVSVKAHALRSRSKHAVFEEMVVALARRLAVIMPRTWVDGTAFRWTEDIATACVARFSPAIDAKSDAQLSSTGRVRTNRPPLADAGPAPIATATQPWPLFP